MVGVLILIAITLFVVLVYANDIWTRIWLSIADRKLVDYMDKTGILDKKHTIKTGRVEASLILAYSAPDFTRLQFIDGDTWSAGVYRVGQRKFSIFMRTLNFDSPHLYFDDKSNNSLAHKELPVFISRSQLVQYEGIVRNKFNLYAPEGYHLDALVVAAPDFLDSIYDNSLGADIEILGNQLYIIFPKGIFLGDKLDQIVESSNLIAKAANDNLSRYLDKHSGSKKGELSYQGRRLIKK